MKISNTGLKLIQELNALRINAYQDNHGCWTIGFGSVRWPDGRLVQEGDKITDEGEAKTLLEYSLQSPIRIVNTHVNARLTQNQFDALVSLVYNIRGRKFNESGITSLLDNDRLEEACKVMESLTDPEYCRVTAGVRGKNALSRMRAREIEIFKMI